MKSKGNKSILAFFIFAGLFFVSLQTKAQVTIGSDKEPNRGVILDLKEKTPTDPKTDNSNSNKGMGLPRVNLTSPTDLFPMFEADGIGTYKIGSTSYSKEDEDRKHVGLLVYNTGDVLEKGMYAWSGTRWELAQGGTEPWQVSGTSDAASSNSEDIYQLGSVAIGDGGHADPTAILNVQAANKGVLLPRVALKSSTDVETIPNPTTGLLVYNTGANTGFTTVGYMFWDGAQWRLFMNSSADPSVAFLNCSGALMSPSQQVIGATAITAGTVLQIPYTGGNGGSYNGVVLTSKGNNAVTAAISSGTLAVGNGMLNFALHGIPSLDQQAPTGIVFDLTPFLDANSGITGCDEVVIGNIVTASIEETAVMGNLMLVTDNTGNDTGTQYYTLQCITPDGKFSIRAGVPVSTKTVAWGDQTLNVQIRNNLSSSVPVVWNFNTDWSGALSYAGILTIPPMRWGGDKGTSNTWTNATGSGALSGTYLGQIGIYDASNYGPEYRRYTWIPQGANNKVAYEATIMVALDTKTPTVAVAPSLVKCYIKISQVTAH